MSKGVVAEGVVEYGVDVVGVWAEVGQQDRRAEPVGCWPWHSFRWASASACGGVLLVIGLAALGTIAPNDGAVPANRPDPAPIIDTTGR